MSEKIPSCFQRGKWTRNHSEICQSTPSLSKTHIKLVNQSPTYWVSPEPNWPGGREIPNSSPLQPPLFYLRQGEKTEKCFVKVTVQGHRLTEDKPRHRITEHFPSPHTSPHPWRPIYSSSFYPVHHVWLSTKKLQGAPKGKRHIWRDSASIIPRRGRDAGIIRLGI